MVVEDFIHDFTGKPAFFYPLFSEVLFPGAGFASELINRRTSKPRGLSPCAQYPLSVNFVGQLFPLVHVIAMKWSEGAGFRKIRGLKGSFRK